MSTLSTHRRADAAAAAAANAEAHIVAAKAAVQQAAETVRAVVAVAEAAVAAAATLHVEDVIDRDGARPRGSHRHHSILPLPIDCRHHIYKSY
jgi:hypothetical protein